MVMVGEHPNVVSLIGACTREGKNSGESHREFCFLNLYYQKTLNYSGFYSRFRIFREFPLVHSMSFFSHFRQRICPTESKRNYFLSLQRLGMSFR